MATATTTTPLPATATTPPLAPGILLATASPA